MPRIHGLSLATPSGLRLSFSRVIPPVLKNSLISGCSRNVDLNEREFYVSTNFLSNLRGPASHDLRLLDGAEIETPRRACGDIPSSVSMGVFSV